MGYNDDHQIAHIRLDRLKELQEKAKKWDKFSTEPIDTAFKKTKRYNELLDLISCFEYNELKEKAQKWDNIDLNLKLGGHSSIDWDMINEWKEKAKKWDEILNQNVLDVRGFEDRINELNEKAKMWDQLCFLIKKTKTDP